MFSVLILRLCKLFYDVKRSSILALLTQHLAVGRVSFCSELKHKGGGSKKRKEGKKIYLYPFPLLPGVGCVTHNVQLNAQTSDVTVALRPFASIVSSIAKYHVTFALRTINNDT